MAKKKSRKIGVVEQLDELRDALSSHLAVVSQAVKRVEARLSALETTVVPSQWEAVAVKLQGDKEVPMNVIEGIKPSEFPEARTALTDKHHSGLVIRKITRFGFPIYVALIADQNPDILDDVVIDHVTTYTELWRSNSIQDKRNLAGELIERLCREFPGLEAAAVVLYIDKTVVSSLYGDFMNHAMCRQELYFLLNMGTAV